MRVRQKKHSGPSGNDESVPCYSNIVPSRPIHSISPQNSANVGNMQSQASVNFSHINMLGLDQSRGVDVKTTWWYHCILGFHGWSSIHGLQKPQLGQAMSAMPARNVYITIRYKNYSLCMSLFAKSHPWRHQLQSKHIFACLQWLLSLKPTCCRRGELQLQLLKLLSRFLVKQDIYIYIYSVRWLTAKG